MELDMPAGVVKTQSESAAAGRYVDTDWVRFASGRPEKVGGWVKTFAQRLMGVPRGMHAYLGPDGFTRLGIGTHLKLYSVTDNGVVKDITPYRRTTTLNNPITTTSGSSDVVIVDNLHGATNGDTVHISGASAVGGITLAGDYIVKNATTNTYVVTHSSPATSAATGGGAATKLEYEVNIGLISGAATAGYGTGYYGMETYGTMRSQNLLTVDPRFWALDNYGNLLLGSYTVGSIYWYNDITDTRAKLLTGSPTDVLFVFVTEERFVMALRAGMYVQWPDQNDPTAWTPSTTNTANTRRLAAGSKLIAGTRLSQGLSLIWTDVALYVMQYTGGQFVYDSRVVGTSCGLVGPAAFCTVDGVAFWMSRSGFHTYSGYVQAVPRSNEISNWVFGDSPDGDAFNAAQGVKTVCYYNAEFREVWWIYAAGDSDEPNHYVMTCLDDFSWANGTLERVGHAAPVGANKLPYMSSFDGYVYTHESGVDADGAVLPWRLRTGLIRVANGAQIVDILGFSPDMDRQTGVITLTIAGRDRPNSKQIDSEVLVFDNLTEMLDFRISGRHIEFTLEQSQLKGDFRLGVPFIEDQAGGARR